MAAALKEGKEEMAKKVLDLLDQNSEPKQEKGKIRREAENAFKGLDEETTVKFCELLTEAKILGEGDLVTLDLRVSRQHLNTKSAKQQSRFHFISSHDMLGDMLNIFLRDSFLLVRGYMYLISLKLLVNQIF